MRFAFIRALRPTYVTFGLLMAVLFSSCGNESSWTYKAWHNTLAHYNIYFNGEQKWLETYQAVRESYKDDFRKPINLFNYGTTESLQGNLGAMDEVVKKASTMIDKHPKSKWVDDAYFLTGKAYLFKGDPVAAINIFDFVSSQYKDPKIVFQAKLWSVRALLIQGKIIDAEAMAAAILKNPKLPKELLHVAQFTLGAIYHQQQKYQQSADLLQKALPRLTNRMDCYRTHFALGQAYQKTGDYSKSEKAYAKVPRFNPPYDITFNSQIEQVSILSAQQRDFAKANKILNRMLKDDKNLEYKGQIYYRMALNELDAGNTQKAIETLKVSVQQSITDKNQKTSSYLKIGDIYYQQKAYLQAGIYYDSANRVLDETHPDFETILAKNQIVTDLLEHLVRITQNDSLIRLVRDENFLAEKIKTAKRKEKEIEERSKALAEQSKNQTSPGFPTSPGMPMNPNLGGTSSGSSFPFYNIVTRKNGIAEFNRTYGERPNVDFWKYSSKMQLSNTATKKDTDDNSTSDKDSTSKQKKTEIANNRLKNIAKEDRKYYENLPFDADQQAKLLQEIEISLFESAGIYANKLNEYETAQNQYLNLIIRFANSAYLPQTYYELIKIHRIENHPSLARLYTDTLKTKFPESIYVKMIDNPEAINSIRNPQAENNQIIQDSYDSMLIAFQNKQYQEAIQIKLNTDKTYSGNSLQPRFDFVYGLCLLKSDSVKAAEIFKQISLDYPNTDVSQRSKSILISLEKRNIAALPDSVKNLLSGGSSFSMPKATDKIDALIILPKTTNVNMAKALISDLNKKEFSFDNLIMGRHIPIKDSYIMLIENFSSSDKTQFYVRYLSQQTDLFNSRGIFKYETLSISNENLQLLLKSENLEEYRNWYKSKFSGLD
jgi:tetratricopeptide (TPR) repeat protein